MSWLRTLVLGLKSLRLHPLRSSLTVLGIFIGVTSVIWLLAIGEGISAKAQEQIEGLGANNIILLSVKPPAETTSNRGIVPYGLTRDDFDVLVETIPTIDRALPIREIRRQFRYADRMVEGRLVGCTPEYAEVMQLEVERGRGHFISDAEVAEKDNVCVLAAGTAERLFPFENPIGRAIHVDDEYYVVVGVMRDRTAMAGIGGSLAAQDFRHDVYIPISTLWKRIGDFVTTRRSGSWEGETIEISQVTLRVKEASQRDPTANVLETSEIVQATIDARHDSEDVSMVVPLELLEQARTTRLMFILFMGMIAAISLVVGGIGIMNIMLATVTERTREIGIRRALGAKQGDITRQFLVETVMLSMLGGVIGIAAGFTCGPVVRLSRQALDALAPQLMANLPEVIKSVSPEVVPWSVPLAFGISVGVGVIFGLYPAMRAATMDPIEALRHS